MLSSTEKTIIISGTIFGSVFLFSTSLYYVNDLLLRHNNNESHQDNSKTNKLLYINGLTLLFSGVLFSYFTYNAIK